MRALGLSLFLVACGTPPQPPPPASGSGGSSVLGDAAAGDAGPSVDPGPAASAAAADGGVATADPCVVADLESARKEAAAHVKAGKPQQAIDLLTRVVCTLDRSQPQELKDQIAGLRSDVAFALLKAGRPEDCYAAAARELAPHPHTIAEVFEEGAPVLRAISTNAETCRRAAEKKRGQFVQATECAAGEGYGLPPGIGPGPGACLVLEAAKKANPDVGTCGAVTLVQGTTRTQLTAVGEGANVTDPTVCCNIASMSFGKRKNGWAVLVESGGRECGGGTADTSEEHVYEVSGTTMKLAHRLGYTSR